MSRPIKFRCWNNCLREYIPEEELLENFREYMNEDHLYIEQYTGLTDKNGKEIAEGDVVKFLFYNKNRIGKVVFDFVDDSEGYFIEKHYGWGIWLNDDEITSLGDYADNNMKCELVEVIGNIHEYPKFSKRKETKINKK